MRSLLLWVIGGLLLGGLAQASAPRDMLEFDAVYIPALALTTSAAQQPAAADRARAAMQRLQAQWPALRARLARAWPDDTRWATELGRVAQHIAQAQGAVNGAAWSAAHEALEPVRLLLMAARQRHGMGYYVDALTAYHDPMEEIALAGLKLQPAQIDAARRRELEQAFVRARALWRVVERQPIDAQALALTPARHEQLRRAVADESVALEQLSAALRDGDATQLLRAAAAIKPPFARAFTAFGLGAGELALP